MSGVGWAASSVFEWILRAVVESSALVLIACLVDRAFLRKDLARLRPWLWTCVFLRLVVPPLGFETTWQVPIVGLSQPLANAGVERTQALVPADITPGRVAFGLWGLGALALLLRLARKVRNTRQTLESASRQAPQDLLNEVAQIARRAGLRTPPSVRIHRGTTPALLVGWWRPVLVLAENLPNESRQAAIWHEVMHLVRRDPLWQAVLEGIHALWWFHPLLGQAKRRAALARELATDARVMRCWPEGARTYPRTLLREAAALLARQKPAPGYALPWLGSSAQIRQRLEALEPCALGFRFKLRMLATRSLLVATTLAFFGTAVLVKGSTDTEAGFEWLYETSAARAEVELWRKARPGLGCTTGRLVFLRALALEQAHSTP